MERALKFENLEDVFWVILIIIGVVTAVDYMGSIAYTEMYGWNEFAEVLWKVANLFFYITGSVFVALSVFNITHSRMMKCGLEAEHFVELVLIVLDQEESKEQQHDRKELAEQIIEADEEHTVIGLCEKLVAYLVVDLEDAEATRLSAGKVEKARDRFHGTYDALAKIGVPLGKKKSYFSTTVK